MSAVQVQPTATLATAAARGPSLRYALHAEWTKLRTVSGPGWLLLGIAVLTAMVSATTPRSSQAGPDTVRSLVHSACSA